MSKTDAGRPHIRRRLPRSCSAATSLPPRGTQPACHPTGMAIELTAVSYAAVDGFFLTGLAVDRGEVAFGTRADEQYPGGLPRCIPRGRPTIGVLHGRCDLLQGGLDVCPIEIPRKR